MLRSTWRALAAAVALWLVAAHPAQARWLRSESPKFIVYSEGDQGELREFVQRLENFDSVLRAITNVQSPPSAAKLTVYLVPSQYQIRDFDPAAGESLAGFYETSSMEVFAVATTEGQAGWHTGEQTLFHEYTHHFMAQYFPGAYPVWYQEGFAEMCSTVKFFGKEVSFGSYMGERANDITTREWMPIQTVMTSNTGYVEGAAGSMFYAESWLVTHYLSMDPARHAKMLTYLAALMHGQDAETAFKATFGMGFADFQKALEQYSKGAIPYIRYTKIQLPEAAVSITTLPASADRLLPLHAIVLAGQLDDKTKPDVLARVRAEAVRYPDDPLALRTLGAAEIELGDPAKADAALDRALTLDPNDAEALDLKGLRLMKEGRADPAQRQALFEQARPFLARAHQADPNDYRALLLYGESYIELPGAPCDNTVNVLLLAHNLAPQVSEASFAAAGALEETGDYASAIAVLQPVAYSPHPSSGAKEARERLARDRVRLGQSDSTAVALQPTAVSGH